MSPRHWEIERVMRARFRRILAPKGPEQISPGHRPGTGSTTPRRALKGRHNPGQGLHLCRPFRAFPFPWCLGPRGDAPGWFVAAPSGRGETVPDPHFATLTFPSTWSDLGLVTTQG